MLKYILTAVIIICLVLYFYAVSRSSTIKMTGDLITSDAEKKRAMLDKLFVKPILKQKLCEKSQKLLTNEK